MKRRSDGCGVSTRHCARTKGLSGRRAQLIWDLVALNSTPSLALHKEPDVAVGTMGIGVDFGGFFVEALPVGDFERIVNAYPRLTMKRAFADTCCRLVTEKTTVLYPGTNRSPKSRKKLS
jgi:hypothetical protein